jgi:hypothetical protein
MDLGGVGGCVCMARQRPPKRQARLQCSERRGLLAAGRPRVADLLAAVAPLHAEVFPSSDHTRMASRWGLCFLIGGMGGGWRGARGCALARCTFGGCELQLTCSYLLSEALVLHVAELPAPCLPWSRPRSISKVGNGWIELERALPWDMRKSWQVRRS